MSTPTLPTTDDWETPWRSCADSNSANPKQVYHRRPKPMRLLELGSGQGNFARDVLSVRPGWQLVAVEPPAETSGSRGEHR